MTCNYTDAYSMDAVTANIYFRVTYIILLLIVFATSTSGSLFVCYVINSKNMMRKEIWYYVFMLSLADGGQSLFTIPIFVTASIDDNVLSTTWLCNLNHSTMLFFGIWSVYTAAVISLYRQSALSNQQRIRFKYRHVVAYVTVTSIVSLVFSVSPLFEELGSPAVYIRGRKWCVKEPCGGENVAKDLAYSSLLGVFCYFIPLLTIIVTSVRIFIIVRRHVRWRESWSITTGAAGESKTFHTLAIVIAVFLVMWTPLLISVFAGQTGVNIYSLYSDIACLVMLANGSVNPLVYCFRHAVFRDEMKKVFCRQTSTSTLTGPPNDNNNLDCSV